MPSEAVYNSSLLYEAYFTDALTPSEEAKFCRQQCYGYGNEGECKSCFVGYQVPTPKGYEGSSGGQLQTTCLLFKDYLSPLSFVEAPKGQYVNATAASIFCPSS